MSRRVIISAISAAGIIILIIMLFRTRSPFGKSNSEFASAPEKEISGIEFYQEGNELSLEKNGEKWLINGREEARKGGINFIIRILTESKIKSPVSPEMFRSEITDRKITPVLVKVYEGRKLLKSFRVYKTPSNSYGNIMKIKEGSKPFIVHVPGYEVNIGSAFTLKKQYWQPYTIFNMLPSEISSVRFENLTDTASSFSIAKVNRKYSLSGNRIELTGWDPDLVIRYISYFTFIPFETWAFELTSDEISNAMQHDPLYRITVISAEGKTTILSLWQKVKTEDGKQITDTDRLLGKTQNSDDFFIVRYFDIDPVIKERSYFFPSVSQR
jgi:hypothetical protein